MARRKRTGRAIQGMCLAFVLGSIWSGSAAAQSTVPVTRIEAPSVPLGALADVPNASRLVANDWGAPAFWVQIAAPCREGHLEAVPLAEKVHLFTLGDGALIELGRAGHRLALVDRSVLSARVVLPLPPCEGERTLLAKIEMPTPLPISFVYHPPGSFEKVANQAAIIRGVLVGFALAIMIYNLFLSVLVRDSAYLFLALTTFFIIGGSMNMSGVGSAYIWSSLAQHDHAIFNGLFALANMSTCAFIGAFFGWQTLGRWPFRLIVLSIGLSALSIPLHIVMAPWQLYLMVMATIGLVIFTGLLTIGWAFRSGQAARARLYLYPLAGSIIPGTVATIVGYYTGLSPDNLRPHMLEMMLAIEALLYTAALSARIRLAETSARRAQEEVIAHRNLATRRVIESQDAERRRIAQELHSVAGQAVMVVVLRLRRLAGEGGEPQALSETADTAAAMAEDLRRISHELHPVVLDHLTWVEAIEQIFAALECEAGLMVNGQAAIAANVLDEMRGSHLYRIVQDITGNIVKHAHAAHILWSIHHQEHELVLHIVDDGVGIAEFDFHRDIHRSFGLIAINERVRLLGGSWTMASQDGDGVEITVCVPLEQRL